MKETPERTPAGHRWSYGDRVRPGVFFAAVGASVHFFGSELSSDTTENQVFRVIWGRAVVRVSQAGARHTVEPSCGHGAAVTTAGVRETGAWPPVHF